MRPSAAGIVRATGRRTTSSARSIARNALIAGEAWRRSDGMFIRLRGPRWIARWRCTRVVNGVDERDAYERTFFVREAARAMPALPQAGGCGPERVSALRLSSSAQNGTHTGARSGAAPRRRAGTARRGATHAVAFDARDPARHAGDVSPPSLSG